MMQEEYTRPVYVGRLTPGQLREMRKAYGMTQRYLAAKLGIHPITYAQWEGNRYEVPTYLYRVIPSIGFQAILERNQEIIDRYCFRYQEGFDTFCALGKKLNVHYDLHNVFNRHGGLISWQILNCDGYFAIGETNGGTLGDGSWSGYAIPQDANPKPELRHPYPAEMGYFFD